MSSAPAATAPDPYEAKPSFVQRHATQIAATVVGGLTVVLAVLSFPPYDMPQFAYAMLVPGVYWAYTQPSFKLYASTLLAAQAIAWTIILGWLHHVTWVGLFLLGPFVGAWIGVWYLAAWWTMPRMIGQPTLLRLLALLGLAGAWVVVEWTRTWVLGGFPWLPLAASQWKMVSMIQIAAFTGAAGISFVVVAVNLGFAAYAQRLFREGARGFNKRSQEFFLALFLVLTCFSIELQESYNRARYAVPLARVAFVQPYIPQEVKWDPAKAPEIFSTIERLTLTAASTNPDLILWPEAVTPLALRGDASVKQWTESLVKRARAPLVLGSLGFENIGQPTEQWFNGVFVVTPTGGLETDYYAKRHLVPFGEYVPLRPLLGWLKKFVPIGDDDPMWGVDSSPLLVRLKDKPVVLGPLICYEDIFPELARLSAAAGSDALVVVTNNAWFGEGGAAEQHAAHSVLRAIETRRPVLRCGNGGWSGWIDEFGVVRSNLTDEAGSIFFRGTKTTDVTRDARWIGKKSFYVEHGDWFVLASVGLLLLGAGLLRSAPVAAKVAE
jgi:apolipoprotein N-acyltransferase